MNSNNEPVNSDSIRLTITPIGSNKVNVDYNMDYTILYKPAGEGLYSCIIPALDIFYSANNENDIIDLGNILANSFIAHWCSHYTVQRFLQQLRVLKFNPTNDIWQNVVKNKSFIEDRVFKKSNLFKIPPTFKGASRKVVSGDKKKMTLTAA